MILGITEDANEGIPQGKRKRDFKEHFNKYIPK